ncbi:hypothetical protein [Roseibium sediminis]|uniref:hypothetical protein n=1 Tax=Roseibium sediminis TaxID=1775174 RepID=UPI00123D8CD8|nr:hypothetical protein [Roseibium sediminis]
MTRSQTFLTTTALLLSTTLASLGSAQAFEPTGNDVADAFLNLLEAEQGKVESYGEVTESGSTVSITSIKLIDPADDTLNVSIDSTDLVGGKKLESGRLQLDSLALKKLSMTSDRDGSMSIEDFKVTDLVLPTAAELANGPAGAANPSYRTLDISTINIVTEENENVQIARIETEIGDMVDDLPTSMQFSISDVTLDASTISDEDAVSFQEMGYEKITLNVTGAGKWSPDSELAELTDLTINGADMGTLKLNMSFGGVSREVIEKLDDMGENPQMAMSLTQNVSLIGVTIDVIDGSLTNRILEQEASKSGVDKSAYVEQQVQGLNLLLGALNNKEFQDKVSTAVSSFLNDPQSLQVVAAPANPVPFAQIMGTVMLAPQGLPKILGLDVKANQ